MQGGPQRANKSSTIKNKQILLAKTLTETKHAQSLSERHTQYPGWRWVVEMVGRDCWPRCLAGKVDGDGWQRWLVYCNMDGWIDGNLL